MRLIDADALEMAINLADWNNDEDANRAIHAVETAPTVDKVNLGEAQREDTLGCAVPVVRCGECINRGVSYCTVGDNENYDKNWYCASGAKMEG
jgi:hypothetical protein